MRFRQTVHHRLSPPHLEQQHAGISLVLCICVCFCGSDVNSVTQNLLPCSVCTFLPSGSSSDRSRMLCHMQGTVALVSIDGVVHIYRIFCLFLTVSGVLLRPLVEDV